MLLASEFIIFARSSTTPTPIYKNTFNTTRNDVSVSESTSDSTSAFILDKKTALETSPELISFQLITSTLLQVQCFQKKTAHILGVLCT